MGLPSGGPFSFKEMAMSRNSLTQYFKVQNFFVFNESF